MFQHQGYRWFWGNILLGSLGSSLESMIQGWAVLELTNSPFWVGVAAGLRGIGTLLCSFIGGVVADRVNRRTVLILVQVIAGILGMTLGFLQASHRLQLWHLLGATFLQGVMHGISNPTRNALTFDLVGVTALLNAMAANQIAGDLLRIPGPILGGYIIAYGGIEGAYFLLGGSYFIASLALLPIRGISSQALPRTSLWKNLREGLSYTWNHSSIRPLLAMSLMAETFGFSYKFLLPVFARDILGVGASGLGFMTSATGLGALISALIMANLGRVRDRARLLLITVAGFGISLILFSFSFHFLLSLLFLACIGGMTSAYDATMGTIIQTASRNEMRGRVLGIYGFTFGMNPVGGFQSGLIANILGAPVAVAFGGVIVALAALRLTKLTKLLSDE
ncbi:MAG: MFS transporter [Candidatus Tectomicrobia bacterium]|nr:MFS transporter [Candidatus Tectomicrobia bacterium]